MIRMARTFSSLKKFHTDRLVLYEASIISKYVSFLQFSRCYSYSILLLFVREHVLFGGKIVGPWSNGYQCGMRIPRPGFNSQRVPDHGC